MVDPAFKYTNKKCDKCYKKRHIFYFYNSYTSLNKRKLLEKSIILNSNFKKNVSCITQIVGTKMFKTGITQKIIINSDITKHFIIN